MFLVQVSKGKGSYKTRYSTSTYSEAVRWYNGLNVHSGYNKRIVHPDGAILHRTLTY